MEPEEAVIRAVDSSGRRHLRWDHCDYRCSGCSSSHCRCSRPSSCLGDQRAADDAGIDHAASAARFHRQEDRRDIASCSHRGRPRGAGPLRCVHRNQSAARAAHRCRGRRPRHGASALPFGKAFASSCRINRTKPREQVVSMEPPHPASPVADVVSGSDRGSSPPPR